MRLSVYVVRGGGHYFVFCPIVRRDILEAGIVNERRETFRILRIAIFLFNAYNAQAIDVCFEIT